MNRRSRSHDSLLEVLGLGLRYHRRFILVAFLAALGVVVGGLLMPRKYKAEAVFERRTDAVLSQLVNRSGSMPVQDPKQSLAEEIAGQPAVDALGDALRQSPEFRGSESAVPADRQAFYQEVGRQVSVTYDIATPELDRIRLSYVARDPALARAVVNTLASNYIERTQAQLDLKLKESSAFFQNEVTRSRTLIEDLETRKLTFEIDHAALLPDTPDNLQTLTSQTQTQLDTVKQQKTAAAMRVEALQKTLDATPANTPTEVTERNPQLAVLDNRLRDLHAQLEHLLGPQQMTDKHPDVAAVRQQIAQVEEQTKAVPEKVVTQTQLTPNPRHDEIQLLVTNAQTELKSLESQEATLTERLSQFSAQGAKLFPVRADYMKLTRDIDEAQRQLAFWEDNLRRVTMALTAETGNRGVQLSFIKPCDPIIKPVSPDLAQVLIAAVLLAITSGALAVFLSFQTDERIVDTRHIASEFKLPMLGAVGELITRRQRRFRALARAVLYPANLAVMTMAMGLALGLLYLSLQQPQRFDQVKHNPAKMLDLRTYWSSSAAKTDPATAGAPDAVNVPITPVQLPATMPADGQRLAPGNPLNQGAMSTPASPTMSPVPIQPRPAENAGLDAGISDPQGPPMAAGE